MATCRSSAAASTISVRVRTEWSRAVPESHRGYQSCSGDLADVDVVVVDQDHVQVGEGASSARP